MEPVFSQWDFIIVDKVTPRLWEIQREDIIVFVPLWREQAYIKRVIGLPWETIKIREWVVYICDDEESELEECEEHKDYYLPSNFTTSTEQCWRDTFTIGSEGYFVLGDNRDHSTDSRCCFWLACHDDANFLVYDKDLIGKVAIKVYPEISPYW
jgi:signal peptidase I